MDIHEPDAREASPDRPDFLRGLMIALPLSLLLWAAVFLAARWLWPG